MTSFVEFCGVVSDMVVMSFRSKVMIRWLGWRY